MDDKTEAPTPRRRKKAREDGQVARSAELVGSVALLGVLGSSQSLLGGIGQKTSLAFSQTLATLSVGADTERLRFLAGDTLFQASAIAMPAMLVTAGAGVAVNLVQVGILFAPKALQPRWNRIAFGSGLRRMFTGRALMEILKGMLKMGLVGAVGWRFLSGPGQEMFLLSGGDPRQAAGAIGEMAHQMGMQMVGTLAGLAALDYAYQRWQFERSLRMTRQEVKDEMRDIEGNPEVRHRIRQRQREFSRRRMMAEVPTATVVVTNPTHFAVALRYEMGQSGAPRVVAKGQDKIAQRIRQIAQENRVPVVENPPLARSLHAQVELGKEVPTELYRAVAEVLALIWHLDQRRAGSERTGEA